VFQILIVEDDNNARKLMETVITQYGYQPVATRDALEALKILETRHIDLIVLDVMLPQMDGFVFTRTLRESGNDVPILMVTAKESLQDKRLGFLSGTDDYMVKPVDEEEMMLRIAALLRRSHIAADRKLQIGSTELHVPVHHRERKK